MIYNIPSTLPLLLIEEGVVLPGSTIRFRIHSRNSVEFVEKLISRDNVLANTIIGIIPTDPDEPPLTLDKIQESKAIGSVVTLVNAIHINWPRPCYSIEVTGLTRFCVISIEEQSPFPIAKIQLLDRFSVETKNEEDPLSKELQQLKKSFHDEILSLVDLLDPSLEKVKNIKKLVVTVPLNQLVDIFASLVNSSFKEKLDILESHDLEERFQKVLPLIKRQAEGLKMMRSQRRKKTSPTFQVKVERLGFPPSFNKKRTSSLGEDDGEDEMDNLENKLREADLPPYAHNIAKRELKRLKKMSPQMPEYPMIRHYLELVADLPWGKFSTERIDIKKSKHDLDNDHFGLDKAKRRILEYLAVRQLKNSLRGPILCFVGPPGVGKTSIGKSIAKTLGREFHRISLGGVSDQSDIRGHRRTYIGSMPGRFIQGLKTTGTRNPVFLLDEIDKMTAGVHGDPLAALLEVLDPEQNSKFVDHYLNMPFDLSQVMFIATANSLEKIPSALRDRLEVLKIPGYTLEDKFPIARRHLIHKQLQQHGLNEQLVQMTDEAIESIITKYTKEAGVRELERKLGSVCRFVAIKIAEQQDKNQVESEDSKIFNMKAENVCELKTQMELPLIIDQNSLENILGPVIYENHLSDRIRRIGVAVGLAWTPVGGEVMVVETSKMPGDGKLVLTGQLGDVMKESATIALNWVRSNGKQLGISFDGNTNPFEHQDIHIHFPAGGVGKDGPSAGITITIALVSLVLEKLVQPSICFTGEMTLRGVVLPVGGVKEKAIAAKQAGLEKVVLPEKNRKNLADISKSVKDNMHFIFVETIEDVLDAAFQGVLKLSRDRIEHPISKL